MTTVFDRIKDQKVCDGVKHLASLPEWDEAFLPYLNEVEQDVVQRLKREDLSERDTAVCRGELKQIDRLRELRSRLRQR